MANIKILYIIVFNIIISAIFYSCSTTSVIDYNNDEIIREIKNTYAPDLRVSIFNIQGLKHGKNLILKGETNNPQSKRKLIDDFSAKKFNVVDSIHVLPDEKINEVFAVVRLSVCNIRTKPDHTAEMSTQSILGTPLKVYKIMNGWAQVQTPDNYIGWVDLSGIVLMTDDEKSNWLKLPKLISNSQLGFVLESEEEGSRPVSDIVTGSILGLKGESLNKNFWIVSFPDKRIGYVPKNSFRKLEEFAEMMRFVSNDDIVNTAYQFMGAPYLWGGTSSKGMDCSGFTKTVYFLNGLIIPRDASQQVMAGDVVPLDENYSQLQMADLLFFGNKRSDNTDRITHVALYIGNGKFIHSSGNVKIESLRKSDPDYNNFRSASLLQVRRYLNARNRTGLTKLSDASGYFK